MPERSNRVVVVAHCHLDANTKVHGLADFRGARSEVVLPLIEQGVGIVQLPCPEATFLGMKRWGMTREQYSTAAYRRHCRAILGPIVDTLSALAEDGCAIEAVIGVDGSPSCGVTRTPVGYEGGELETVLASGGVPAAVEVARPGVFIDVLRSMLSAAGLDVVFRGVEESAAGA